MNTRRDVIIGRAFGIGAALAYGISQVLIRRGVSDLAPPLVGATIALFSGTIALSIFGARDVNSNLAENKKGVIFLLLSGGTAALGIIASFYAFRLAPVVIVSPLESISPLFALLWSHLFLGKLERITRRVILGSILVVGGVILITLGRS